MSYLANPLIRLALVAGVSIAGAIAQADAQITGSTKGSTASAGPLNPHPKTRDDTDVSTTINITFLSTSTVITEAAKAFPTYNFVFAGAAGVGSNFTPINASAFNIGAYVPWVVDSPNLTSPGGTVYNRGVTGEDAGGTNILIDYTASGADPTSVNFLQAYSLTINGAAKPIVAMDNGTAGAVPYYNKTGASGTDSNDTATVPLDASKAKAWMLDTPYICESGFSPLGTGCPATTAANDETFTSYVDLFDTFIESDQTFMGKSYQVLYGGFTWGFTFTATDVPEPSTWAMLALGFAGLGFLGYTCSKERGLAIKAA